MKLNEIADRPGARKARFRIGRGIGSGAGKTGGRGGKGQTARSGVRIKGFEGGQMPLHRRLPKRGFNNIFALDLGEVNVGNIQKAIDSGKLKAGDELDAAMMVNVGLLRRARDGVRLLGNGEIKSKMTISVHGASKSAIAAVEKAGGTVKILAKAKEAKEPRGKNAQRAAAEARGDKPKAVEAEAPAEDKPKAAKKKADDAAPKAEKPKVDTRGTKKPKA